MIYILYFEFKKLNTILTYIYLNDSKNRNKNVYQIEFLKYFNRFELDSRGLKDLKLS